MGKKSRKDKHFMDFDPYDEFENIDDDGLDLMDDSWDVSDFDGEAFSGSDQRDSFRRKSDRSYDRKKLYSELNDFEEFGGHDN